MSASRMIDAYFLKQCPALMESLLAHGERAREDILMLAEQVVPYGIPLTVRFLEMSPVILNGRDFETLTKTAALACSVARIDHRTAAALMGESAGIMERIGFEGLRRVAAFAVAVAPDSWAHSVRIIQESGPLIDRLFGIGAKSDHILSVYALAAQMAGDNWNIAWEWIEKSPDAVRQLLTNVPEDIVAPCFERARESLPYGAAVTVAFLETAPDLIGRLGLAGAESIWQSAFDMARQDSGHSSAFLKKSRGIIDRYLVHVPPFSLETLFQVIGKLSRMDSLVALKFAGASPDLVERIDEQQFVTLGDRIAAMASRSRAMTTVFIDTAPALLDRAGLEGLEAVGALGMDMADKSWETAARFLLKSPELIDRVGIDGLKMIADFSTILAGESWSAAVSLLDKCPHILDGLMNHGELSLVSRVCHLGRQMIPYNARLAVSLLDRSPDIIGRIGFAGLEQMAETACRTGAESWTTAVSLLETSPLLLDRVGLPGLERLAALACRMAKENSYSAVSFLEKSPGLLDRLLRYGDRKQALAFFELAGETAPDNWRLAAALLDGSPEWVARIGWEGLEKLLALMNRTVERSGKIAKSLLDISAAAIEKMGFSGLEALAEFAAAVAEKDWRAAMDAVEKSLSLIDRLGHEREEAVASVVYGMAAAIARTSPAVAVRLVERSPALIRWVGLDGFGAIAAHIESMARDDEAQALSFLAADSPAFGDFMAGIPQGLELKAIKPILLSYLRALLGRRVEIAEAPEVSTDGRRIYLPGRIKDFQDNEDNFRLYKVSATHQEAHLEYGSFDFDFFRISDLTHRLRSRYGTEDGNEHESDIERFVHVFPEPDLARDLFNLFEDFRIESVLRREYPALGEEMVRMNRHMTTKRRSPAKMTNAKERTVEMTAQALLAHKIFDDRSDPAVSVCHRILALAESLRSPGADVHDTAHATASAYARIDEAFRESYRPVKPTSKPLDQETVSRNIGSFSRTSRQIRDRLEGREPGHSRSDGPAVESPSETTPDSTPAQTRPVQEHVGRRPRPNVRDQRSFRGTSGSGEQRAGDAAQDREDSEETGDALAYSSEEKIERLLRAAYREEGVTPKEIERRLESMNLNDVYLLLLSLQTSLDKKTELQMEQGTFLYAEWGEDIQDYRGNWTRIREQTHRTASLDFYRETVDRYGGLLKKIRREFQMLKPEGVIRRKGQYDGDDIDLDAVVEFLVDRKAGLSPVEKYYSFVQRRQRDIAVAFLVDMSRSTKGDTMTKEKESLLIMSEALSEVGDAFAIYGFSGDNRDNVDFYRIKDFDDRYDQQVKKRISAIEDHFENRDGAAIRHAVSKLRRRPERTKMMILLSDGKPVDKEYSGAYAIEDTRMALKEAQHYGIKTVCITVDRAAAEYLPRMYSHSRWTVIDDVAKLPEKITRIYRMITA